jgi:hypothetical protein
MYTVSSNVYAIEVPSSPQLTVIRGETVNILHVCIKMLTFNAWALHDETICMKQILFTLVRYDE